MLSEKKLFLFDIDGTVALGDVLLPGAAEFFQEIKERGGQFVFITNNSTKSIADYIKKFRQGVSTDPQNFVTASTASASWLRQHAAGKTIYTLGTRSLIRELEGHGIRVTTDPDTQDISFVLVAYDSELTYKKLPHPADPPCHLPGHQPGSGLPGPIWLCTRLWLHMSDDH